MLAVGTMWLTRGLYLFAAPQVREFVEGTGLENIGKRLINSREGKVTFEKPNINLDALIDYGNLLVEEQENVRRVQLADAYMSGSELAGSGKPVQSLMN